MTFEKKIQAIFQHLMAWIKPANQEISINTAAAMHRDLPDPIPFNAQYKPPDTEKDIASTRFLAVDLELSSLQPETGEIISIGWVPIDDLQINVGQAKHLLLKNRHGVGQSATIHGIHDRQLTNGLELQAALTELYQALDGRVLIAHHAPLDMTFIEYFSQLSYHNAPEIIALDTLITEKNRLLNTGHVIPANSLRLKACMERYHIPLGKQHNALSDAFSCAQLFLAQIEHRQCQQQTVAEFLRYYY